MEIANLKLHPFSELIARLRNLTMLADKSMKPYEEALITHLPVPNPYNLLVPAQRYVLASELRKVIELDFAMRNHGINIFNIPSKILDPNGPIAGPASHANRLGFIEFDVCAFSPDLKESWQTITLLPPVIEYTTESNGVSNNLINDGMHRCFMGIQYSMVIGTVMIRNPKVPYYAYPLSGGWSDVKMVDTISDTAFKKFHRFENYKAYYRDFNSVFTNVGGPRGK